MDLTSPKIIKELFKKYSARPSKGLGQNFLIDKNVLKKIIGAADLKPTDTVLEIGPGIGTLTQELASRAGKVIAVEKDRHMVQILEKTLANFNNIKLVQGNVLKLGNFEIKKLIENCKFKIENYKIVANIPYYLTSPLIRMFLESAKPPSDFVLMLQKEVAQRICAKPPNMSLLSVSVQFYAEPKIISYVSKNCFWPSPKVDSAIIKIVPHSKRGPTSPKLAPEFLGGRASPSLFFRIVKAGFSQPRKQLAGNLSKGLKLDKKEAESWLSKNNIKPAQRAETLNVDDWKNLANTLPRW